MLATNSSAGRMIPGLLTAPRPSKTRFVKTSLWAGTVREQRDASWVVSPWIYSSGAKDLANLWVDLRTPNPATAAHGLTLIWEHFADTDRSQTSDQHGPPCWMRTHFGLWLCAGTSDSGVLPDQILEFPNEPYRVVRPIPVHFEVGEPAGIIASFKGANISIVGETWFEAYNGLKAEILDTLEDYMQNEGHLGPEPRRQLVVLGNHIQQCEDDKC